MCESGTQGQAPPPLDGVAPGAGRTDRAELADLWEGSADERERLADERETLADERDRLADERDRLADRQERALGRREADEPVHPAPIDEAAEAAALQAALLRAEAAVRRAETELERTQQAAARLRASATRRAAATQRAVAASRAGEAADAEEGAWLADRRDFVATERDRLADQRDVTADRREEAAGLRERAADDRARELLAWERYLDGARPAGRRAAAAPPAAGGEPSTDRDARTDGERRREGAAAARRAAAQDRTVAAARWGPQQYGPMLLASFAPLARQLFGNHDLHEVLTQVLDFTVRNVAGCDCASITVYRDGRVIVTVTSGPFAAELDDIQFATGVGPAPEAMHSEGPVYAADLRRSPRWAALADTAAQLDVRSALCHGLFVHRPVQWATLGTFNLYGAAPDAFRSDDREFASVLAAYLAVAIDQDRDEADRRESAVHRALSSRDVIGQAKGILMERQHLSAGDAFDLLRRASQRLNRKLIDIAEQLTETGELPT